MRILANYLFASVAAAALLAAGAANAADLSLKRVLLSTGGVGLFEYEAQVEGDAVVELKVRLDQVDDVLKSLVVFDDHGGVGGLDLASAEPLSETFRPLPFSQVDLQSTPKLLSALKGAEVEVGGSRALSGRIVAVTEETETKPGGGASTPLHRVTIMGEKGLEQFVLEQADSVKFADPSVREAISTALKAIATNHERDSRVLRLVTKGADKRTLRVAYLTAAPVWKTSYRLVLDPSPDAKTGALQGWATLENLSGQDWSGVDLTLVSGRPVAYKQALYRAYMIDRPDAPLDIGAQLAPGVDNGALVASDLAARKAARPRMADALASPMAQRLGALSYDASNTLTPENLAASLRPVAAEETQTQVSFHIPFPVSVGSGRTLSLPIVDAQEPVQRIALYEPQTDPRHPLSVAELVNDGKAALPPGVVTIYETGANGASYVGDSRLSPTPAAEKRLLSFALDQKTTIEEDDSDNTSLARARIVRGVLTIDNLIRRRTAFHVKADEPRRLMVFVPKLAGGRLTAPAVTGLTEADGSYRIPFDVKAGDGQVFAATQESTQTQAIALAGVDDATLSVYASSGAIDAQTRITLATLAQLREVQVNAGQAVSAARNKIDETVTDQTRLKDLLGAAVSGSDLQKRYLKKLDADETELEMRQAELVKLAKAADAAQKAVDAFVAGL